jgi:hypothetical protein
MFEIVYNKKVYNVYSVRDNQENNLPEFLIYINYHWVWLPCFECSPIERYKNEEYLL